MRNNRNSSRNFFVNFVRFGMLAMCFALVFALVLSGGIFDLGSSSDGVAFAASMGASSESIKSDAELSLASLGFPGNSAGKTAWAQNLTFKNTAFSLNTNVSLASENDSLNTSNTSISSISAANNGGCLLYTSPSPRDTR